MGQFSVTFSYLTGSDLSDIQHHILERIHLRIIGRNDENIVVADRTFFVITIVGCRSDLTR